MGTKVNVVRKVYSYKIIKKESHVLVLILGWVSFLANCFVGMRCEGEGQCALGYVHENPPPSLRGRFLLYVARVLQQLHRADEKDQRQ